MDNILGYPVIWKDDLPEIGELELGDFSSYLIPTTIEDCKVGDVLTLSSDKKIIRAKIIAIEQPTC